MGSPSSCYRLRAFACRATGIQRALFLFSSVWFRFFRVFVRPFAVVLVVSFLLGCLLSVFCASRFVFAVLVCSVQLTVFSVEVARGTLESYGSSAQCRALAA